MFVVVAATGPHPVRGEMFAGVEVVESHIQLLTELVLAPTQFYKHQTPTEFGVEAIR
jgi:hypothetical protein